MFFDLKTKKEIGEYLNCLIKKSYNTRRDFCRKVLEYGGGNDLDNLCTKYSDIVNGKNSIKVEDLPIVTTILDVTCEDLLSCGKYKVPKSLHISNYYVASSDSPEVWESYMNRDDKIFLNSDEYGKTVLDYALEFRNFDFLKFLFDNEYIFLSDKKDRSNYVLSFGVKTSIESRNNYRVPIQLQEEDRIRTQFAMLAIEYKDINLLNKLMAKEIPAFYNLHPTYFVPGDLMSVDKYRNGDLIDAIASADEEILDYFSKPIIVKDLCENENEYLFPYINEVIDVLIKNIEPRKADFLLRRVIKHIEKVLKKLTKLTEEALQIYKEASLLYSGEDALLRQSIKENIWMDKGIGRSIVGFCIRNADHKGMISNFFKISVMPNKSFLEELAAEANELYDKILKIKENDNGLTI